MPKMLDQLMNYYITWKYIKKVKHMKVRRDLMMVKRKEDM